MFEELKKQLRQEIGNSQVTDVNDNTARKLRAIADKADNNRDFKKVIACYEIIANDIGLDSDNDTAKIMLLHRYCECGYSKSKEALNLALICLKSVDDYNNNHNTDIIMPDIQMSAIEILAANDYSQYRNQIIEIAEKNFYIMLNNYNQNHNFPNAALTLDLACRILMKAYIHDNRYDDAIDLLYVQMPDELFNIVHKVYGCILQAYLLDPKGCNTEKDADDMIENLKECDLPEAFWALGVMSAEGYHIPKSTNTAKDYFAKANKAVEKYKGTIGYTDFEFSVLSDIPQDEIIKQSQAGTYNSKFYIAKTKRDTASTTSSLSPHNSNTSNSNSSSSNSSSNSSGGCYVATCVYGSYDCPPVWTLRRFRDNTLAQNPFGRLFIKFYYSVSPLAVKLFGNQKWFHKLFKKPLDNLVSELNNSGVENTPYDD